MFFFSICEPLSRHQLQFQKQTVDFLHMKTRTGTKGVDVVFAPVPLYAFADLFPKFAARRGVTMDVGPASVGECF